MRGVPDPPELVGAEGAAAATSNSAVALDTSLSNWLTDRSKTPSPRRSTTPTAETLIACVRQAPSTPPTEWVGYSSGG